MTVNIDGERRLRALKAQLSELRTRKRKEAADYDKKICELRTRIRRTEKPVRDRRLMTIGLIVDEALGMELDSPEKREALRRQLSAAQDAAGGTYSCGSWLAVNIMADEIMKKQFNNGKGAKKE